MTLGKQNIRRSMTPLGCFCALIVSLTFGVEVDPAFARNWHHKAGDSYVYFHKCKLAYNTHVAVHRNGDHDIGPTDITRRERHGCETVDVRINDYPFGLDDYPGWWECHRWYSANGCDWGHVHINTSYTDIPENYYVTLSLVCEEVGHSAGLDHRGRYANTCMNDYDNLNL